MTGTWHAQPDLLNEYARGTLDPAREASVDTHLQRCPTCRVAVGDFADRPLVDEVWADVVDVLDRPRRSAVERFAVRLRLRPDLVRLAIGATAAQRAWSGALVAVAAFALAAPGLPASLRLAFLVAAPLIPVAAVATAYGPRVDPMFEVALAAPFPAARLLMLRCVAVLPTAALLNLFAGLLLPGGWLLGVLWLLPAAGLTLLTLAFEIRFGQWRVGAVVLVGWLALITASITVTGSVLPVFGPIGQGAFAALAVLSMVALARGRLEMWRA